MTSIADRIIRADTLAHRARVYLDLFRAMRLNTMVEPFEDQFDEYDDFFRFTSDAHEAAYINRITNLLHPHKATENLPDLIAKARKADVITVELASELRAELDELAPTFEGLKHVRNNAMAHQHRVISQVEAYEKAQLTLDAMLEVSDRVIGITSQMMRAIGLEARTALTRPVDTLHRMLRRLQAADPFARDPIDEHPQAGVG